MPRANNPKKIRPLNQNRFRGVTSALVNSAVPDNLSTTMHNLESDEIRQITTRAGSQRLTSEVVILPGEFESIADTYDGDVLERFVGAETSAMAEGTNVWSSLLFPFPTLPTSAFDFDPPFPDFKPPSWPDDPEVEFPTVAQPDIFLHNWGGGGDPFAPKDPTPPVPPYEGPDAPTDAPYGPEEPPGFQQPPGPSTPCQWVQKFRRTKFRVDIQVIKWSHYFENANHATQVQCIGNFCETSRLNCANFAEASATALATARKWLYALNSPPNTGIDTSGLCETLDWTREDTEEDEGDFGVFIPIPICGNPEFPTGNTLSPPHARWKNNFARWIVKVDVLVLNYKPLAGATNMCRLPAIELVWDNGYRKTVQGRQESVRELDGDDLLMEDIDLGRISPLKAATGYPDNTPCDLDTSSAFMVCEQPYWEWDCNGAPPPPIKFGS